jgi:hypothetical protein
MPRSAIEKRDVPMEPEVQLLRTSKSPNYPVGKMLISTPSEIDRVVLSIRRGKTLRMGELRQKLARAHGADYTCPLTTGIFLRIVAEAAEEERALGRKQVTPWWRVVREDGSVNDKMPGGAAAHAKHLRDEGHTLTRRGKSSWRLAPST